MPWPRALCSAGHSNNHGLAANATFIYSFTAKQWIHTEFRHQEDHILDDTWEEVFLVFPSTRKNRMWETLSQMSNQEGKATAFIWARQMPCRWCRIIQSFQWLRNKSVLFPSLSMFLSFSSFFAHAFLLIDNSQRQFHIQIFIHYNIELFFTPNSCFFLQKKILHKHNQTMFSLSLININQ